MHRDLIGVACYLVLFGWVVFLALTHSLLEEITHMAGFTPSYSYLPPVVKSLLIVNGIMFVLQMSSGNQLIVELALWRCGPGILRAGLLLALPRRISSRTSW